jgi:hypothetical protein
LEFCTHPNRFAYANSTATRRAHRRKSWECKHNRRLPKRGYADYCTEILRFLQGCKTSEWCSKANSEVRTKMPCLPDLTDWAACGCFAARNAGFEAAFLAAGAIQFRPLVRYFTIFVCGSCNCLSANILRCYRRTIQDNHIRKRHIHKRDCLMRSF